MKKILLVAAATASMLSMNAESVTINHETSGALATELQAAIDADPDDALTAMSDITELTIVGEAALNVADFTAIRANLRPSLVFLDLSGAVFANNKLPGDDYAKEGILNKMNFVEVKLPETLTGLSGGAFFKCRKLEKVNLPEGIKTINQYCFSGCSKLKIEKLPSYLVKIEPDAFRGCSSLELTELPVTVTSIRGNAFNDDEEPGYQTPAPGIAFTKLPPGLEVLGECAFRRTGCTFSEWPVTLTTVPKSAFAATSVAFKELSPNITSVGQYAFQSVKTMSEFTIPNQAGLWSTIPIGCFFVAADDVKRTFICRAPTAPAATVEVGSSKWSGSFSQVASNPNTTFKVLASAMESYETTAPYSSMNLVALTTPVQAPVIDIDGGDASKCIVYVTVAGKEHSDFSEEVYEGEGEFTIEVSSNTANNEAFYIERISYIEPEYYAEGEEIQEPADENLLYAATGEVKDLVDRPVSVPVTVAPGMKQLHVKVANAYYVLTGVEAVDAPANSIRRVGDTIYMTLPGAQLYDIAGRMVLSTSDNTVDLSMLPAGTYVLRAGNTSMKILK